ncbi:hypothetical protein [Pedobacter cryophilus]|uniref:DUF4440 domain-containing protein n=1 Tax=Pedobacter cryophilus TaxID=2571271 RepID=A0A4U1C8K7_9SPHI|nr:hypothetical protein [Pedobacter cryophilus]TKC01034.1 hypothetical protein FA046_04990 [Pedobacter cryophilus]
MKNIIALSFLILIVASHSFSQTNDGMVKSLINAEERFNVNVKKDGLNQAFLKVADPNCTVFRPNPINAIAFYTQQKQTSFYLSWKPEYAMISKSGDFGFTTGPYVFNNDDKVDYGHYISVWKANNKKQWKLVLDGGIEHEKPISVLELAYLDPTNYKYPKLIGPQKIQWREDIVFNTDILLGKSLNKSGNKSLDEFYDPKVRLYFPNHLPKIGKEETLKFINEQKLVVNSTPTFADRALSGDLAYTYGKAIISGKDYNYIRIWQIDQEMKWNIILDAYLP